MKYGLRISERQQSMLREHLFPGDGKEALAFALCGVLVFEERTILTVHKLFPIRYEICDRKEDFLEWPTNAIESLLEEARIRKLNVLKVHSHPTGFPNFSVADNKSDRIFKRTTNFWWDHQGIAASAIMLPDGSIIGRVIGSEEEFYTIDKIAVNGQSITLSDKHQNSSLEDGDMRNLQAFGAKTLKILKSMKVGVVGCSGTGSPTIQQLGRLGVGKLVLVDPDRVEHKNLNRIIGAMHQDAESNALKVDVMRRMVEELGMGSTVTTYSENIFNNFTCLLDLASCDVIFGCVDSVDGRDLINRLSTFYLIPYFDLGVSLYSNGNGGISFFGGQVHYVFPGSPSLLERGLFTVEDLTAANVLRTDPFGFDSRVKNDYIKDIRVDRPMVAPINFQISALAINEFLAAIHPIRKPDVEINQFRWIGTFAEFEPAKVIAESPSEDLGRGTTEPFLDMPEFSTMAHSHEIH